MRFFTYQNRLFECFKKNNLEAFMEEVSRDADMRYKDRLVRKEKMETFKKQAGLAFRRGEYERALICYTKVNGKTGEG